MPDEPKPLIWVGSSYRDFCALPRQVVAEMGFALFVAQCGDKHPNAKPLKGFGGASLLEIVEYWRGDAFRCVYTVRLADAVYVLHAFQKKSKRGIATPRADLELIRTRLQIAQRMAEQDE